MTTPAGSRPRRNRAGALSLAAASAGFAVLAALRHAGLAAGPGWSVLQSGFEAGMVGGCADWFAVSALFRPIPSRRWSLPHTDIIVRGRARLALGIVDMVQNRWLSPGTLAEHLGRLSASGFLLERLADPSLRAQVLAAARDLLGRFAGSLDAPEVAGFLDRALRDQLADLDLGPPLGAWLEARITAGDTRPLWDLLAASLADGAERGAFQGPIRGMLEAAMADYRSQGFWQQLKATAGELFFDYDEVAASLGGGFGRTLRALQGDPGHPLRARLDEQFTAFAQRLARGDREARAVLAGFQRRFTENAELAPVLARILARLQETLQDQLRHPGGDLPRLLDRLLENLLAELRREPETQARLDAWVRQWILDLAAGNHHVIGEMVQSALARLSDRDLVAQIEEKVGADLQFIRLNGAVVGSLVGMALALVRLALG